MEARKLAACHGLFFLNKFVLLEWKQSFLYSQSASSPHTPPSELAAKQKAAGIRRARLHWLASGPYGLWAFTQARYKLARVRLVAPFDERPSELKQVTSGDVTTRKALIGL